LNFPIHATVGATKNDPTHADRDNGSGINEMNVVQIVALRNGILPLPIKLGEAFRYAKPQHHTAQKRLEKSGFHGTLLNG
jgi:hypothetical protein